MNSRPRLLLADVDVRGRLRALSALRSTYEVHTLAHDEDPLRATRRIRPDAILLGMPRAKEGETSRRCRAIKTDTSSPPMVGIVDRWCRLEDPGGVLSSCLGDGYLGGLATPDEIRAFTADLLRGRKPVHIHDAAPRILDRMLNVFRRS